MVTEASKRVKGRSPSYPGIDLEEAINRARTLYEKERRNRVPVMTALEHWGYKSATGPGSIVLAALKKFGLLDDEGSGQDRHVRLTDRALSIIQDQREDSAERDTLIREAALAPAIHRQLWDEYGGELPSDSNLRYKLLRERNFTESGVSDFLPQFRRTIAFSRLTPGDRLLSKPESDAGSDMVGGGASVVGAGGIASAEAFGTPTVFSDSQRWRLGPQTVAEIRIAGKLDARMVKRLRQYIDLLAASIEDEPDTTDDEAPE